MKDFLRELPVAHRGLHDDVFPENSLGAFRAAAEKGYAIETDVHFTKDGLLAVYHDDDLKRMTGDPRELKDCTLAELKELRLAGTEEQIPSFAEFLAAVDGRVPLLIEIKDMKDVKGDRIAKAIAGEFDRVHYKGEYAIQSFNPFYVKAYKKLRPAVPCGILAYWNMREEREGFVWKIKAYLLSHLKFNRSVKPDFISYGFVDLPKKCVTKFKGIKLAWTIRSEADEQRARRYTDNIIFENYLAEK